MKATTKQLDGVHIVEVVGTGKIFHDLGEVRATLDELLAKKDMTPHIVIDTAALPIPDLGLLAELLKYAKLAREKDGDIRFANTSPTFAATLRNLHYDRLLQSYPTMGAAMESYLQANPPQTTPPEPAQQP